jgi:hypothetical protein
LKVSLQIKLRRKFPKFKKKTEISVNLSDFSPGKKYVLNANVSEKAGRENRVPPRYQRPTSDRIAGPIGRPGGNDSHFFSLQEREFPIFCF